MLRVQIIVADAEAQESAQFQLDFVLDVDSHSEVAILGEVLCSLLEQHQVADAVQTLREVAGAGQAEHVLVRAP